ILYSLDDDASGRFTIDGSTGVVTVADGTLLNRETAASHDITVRAASSDGSSNTQLMTISVNDVDEFDVGTITDNDATANSVNENAANGTTVAVTAFASDADATNHVITYSLDDNAGGRFAIDGSTGVVTVADGTLLDRETAASHDITVRAASSDGSSNTQLMTISVNDVDEFDVGTITDNDATANSVNENAANGTTVAVTAFASDADATNNTILYSLDDNAGGRFAIDGASGVVTVADGTLLDRESAAVHNIIVRATSADGSFDTTVMTININAVNDNDPVIISDGGGASSIVSVSENGLSVTTVSATDADLPAETLTYSIAGGVDATKFTIDNATGVLTFLSVPDYETPTDVGGDNIYDVTVQVSDSTRTDTQAIAVTVTDANESPTIATNTGATVLEGSIGTTITTTMLNEGDVDDSGAGLTFTVTNSIANGTLNLSGFGILQLGDTFTQADIDAGNMTYDHDGSETIGDSFGFSMADGGEDGSLAVVGMFDFVITPTNDAPISISDSFEVDNDSMLNVNSPGILANDSDVDSGTLSVLLVTGPANGTFTLAADGSFTYIAANGFSGTDNFVYMVSDGTDVSIATTVTITVNDVFGTPATEPDPDPEVVDPVEEESEDDENALDEPTAIVGMPESLISIEVETPRQVKQVNPAEPVLGVSVAPVSNEAIVDSEGERDALSEHSARHATYSQINIDDRRHSNSLYLSAFFEFDTGSLFHQLNSVMDDLQNHDSSLELAAGTAVVTSGAVSVGFVIWAARASYFATMLSTSLPAWAIIDPVPVLDAGAVAKRSEKRVRQRHNQSLADIVDEVQVSVAVQLLDDHLCPAGTQLDAVTRDISKDGMGLVCSEPIVASHIRLQLTTPQGQAMDVLGNVRHCSPDGEKYHVGISIVADWT
ncbi:cadherin domain-containing protein, partial [Novipirellula herctigrandis]